MAKELVTMYEQTPATVIREVTGRTYYSIYKELREEGVEIRPRGRRPVLENPGKEVLEAKKALGMSQARIAQEYGVSKRTVQRWMEKE